MVLALTGFGGGYLAESISCAVAGEWNWGNPLCDGQQLQVLGDGIKAGIIGNFVLNMTNG